MSVHATVTVAPVVAHLQTGAVRQARQGRTNGGPPRVGVGPQAQGVGCFGGESHVVGVHDDVPQVAPSLETCGPTFAVPEGVCDGATTTRPAISQDVRQVVAEHRPNQRETARPVGSGEPF